MCEAVLLGQFIQLGKARGARYRVSRGWVKVEKAWVWVAVQFEQSIHQAKAQGARYRVSIGGQQERPRGACAAAHLGRCIQHRG